MKILYLSWDLPELLKNSDNFCGGAAVEWYSWIKGILANNHKFILLSYKGSIDYIEKRLDFEIIESYDKNKGIKKLRWLYYRFPSLYFAVKKSKPDFTISEGATALSGMLAIISKLLNIPYIYRIANDPDVDDRLKSIKGFYDYHFYKIGLKLTRYIIAQNSYQYNKIKERYPNKKVIILHNPYIIENNDIPISPKNREYIAWVGNFRYQKNLKALSEIALKLSNYNFKIAGLPYPNLDGETSNALKSLKSLNNVEFVGYIKRSSINNFFKKAKILLNTSRWEGFSNTFLEAWAAGVPVVTTKNVNPDDLISKYKLGLVADDYSDLPDKINEIINAPDYEEYVKRTHNYVDKHHNPELLAKAMVDFVQNKDYDI